MPILRQKIDAVSEGNQKVVRFELLDQADAAATPLSASYRVDDPISGRAITGWTACVAPTDTIDVTITGAENSLDPTGDGTDEQREVTLAAIYSGETFYAVAYYTVEALAFAP